MYTAAVVLSSIFISAKQTKTYNFNIISKTEPGNQITKPGNQHLIIFILNLVLCLVVLLLGVLLYQCCAARQLVGSVLVAVAVCLQL